MTKRRLKYRKMTDREIVLAKDFIKKYEKIRPKGQQYKSDYERTLSKKKRGWKTEVTENIRGLKI